MKELTTHSQDSEEVASQANEVISGVTKCIDRGEGKGKCHVFLDGSDLCQCEDVDLTKERMR